MKDLFPVTLPRLRGSSLRGQVGRAGLDERLVSGSQEAHSQTEGGPGGVGETPTLWGCSSPVLGENA
jgi:hypothetical protein